MDSPKVVALSVVVVASMAGMMKIMRIFILKIDQRFDG
jgi:hypothetical protein